MSDLVFGQAYADQYDLLYHDKDYEAECDVLEEIFRRYADEPVHTLLDLGCGTGNHALPLARRGYQVTGVDRSPDMLAQARQKALSEAQGAPIFCEGDVRQVELSQPFDAVLMMFAVLGYQLTNQDVLAALCAVRRHLKPGGLFVYDVWYGPAVLAIRPGDRVKVIPTSDGKVIRAASGTLDTDRHVAEVHYQLWRLSGQRLVSETSETHAMRYFFPQELAFYLTSAALAPVHLAAFPTLDQRPSQDTWNVLGVARAISNTP